MAGTEFDDNVHSVREWHRMAEVMPLLETLLVSIEKGIDKEMLAMDPADPRYTSAAVAGWAERRAVAKIRKSLTNVVKRGKTASKTIAPNM